MKSIFLLSQLDIGKRKYVDLKRVCKTEGIIFPSYKYLTLYRKHITLDQELKNIRDQSQVSIGIGISYQLIIKQTISRLVETLATFINSDFPLTFTETDGLDGCGSHPVYNQLSCLYDSKNYLLFVIKPLSIKDSNDHFIWENKTPNSHFQVRLVLLLGKRRERLTLIRNFHYSRSFRIKSEWYTPGAWSRKSCHRAEYV